MSDATSGTKQFIIKALVVFVVVAAGVATGMVVAVRSGLTDKLHDHTDDETGLTNRSALETGTQFPGIMVENEEGQQVGIRETFGGKKTIIGFVSDGCLSCFTFVDAFEPVVAAGGTDYQFILLSEAPEQFSLTYDLPTFRVGMEALREWEISIYPTVVGIDEEGTIRFVSSGFSRNLTQKFIAETL